MPLRRVVGVAVALALLSAMSPHAWAAEEEGEEACPAGTKSLEEYWTTAVKKELKYDGDYLDLLLRDTPTFTTRSQQDSSPSANGTDATLVNAAAFTKLLSAAFDQTAGDGEGDDNEGFTLNVNPFLLAVIANNDIYYSPSRYLEEPYKIMRRFGGTVTFGGKGESFDRDGDGQADDALESSALDDIVTWELRARLWGSRDRRENYKEIFAAVKIEEQGDAKVRVLKTLREEKASHEDDPACVYVEQWDKYQTLIDSPLAPSIEANQAYLDALKRIDERLLITAVLTGVERKEEFGSDKHGIGVRATWKDLNANFDWTHMDGLTNDGEDIDEYRVAVEYGTQILKGWSFKKGADPDKPSQGWLKNGIDASLAFALEIYNDTPDVEHTTTAKLQGKLEIPVSEGVRMPISITWANHEDLLDDDDKIIGHIGVNLDTDKLMGLAKGLL